MHRIYLSILLLILLVSNLFSQGDDRNRIFRCAHLFGDSITFLNDFDINLDKRKTEEDVNGAEWDVYLMKGTEYRFALCSSEGINDKILRLYDVASTEEIPLGSTGSQKKSNSYFDFICKRSDVYKVSIRFKKEDLMGKPLHAIGILGFIRKVRL